MSKDELRALLDDHGHALVAAGARLEQLKASEDDQALLEQIDLTLRDALYQLGRLDCEDGLDLPSVGWYDRRGEEILRVRCYHLGEPGAQVAVAYSERL